MTCNHSNTSHVCSRGSSEYYECKACGEMLSESTRAVDTTQAAGLTDLPERLEAEIVRTVSLDILHQAAACEIRRLRAALAAQAVPAVTDDMRNAVRWAPSSAYWSEKLKEFFGPDARTGIDALEKQLREALAAQKEKTNGRV